MIGDGFLSPGLVGLGAATHPRALELGGELVYGAIDSISGSLYVYEGGTLHSVGSTPIADDHNAPAVLAFSDKPPIVAWTRHNQDGVVRYRLGSVNADFTSLGSEQTLNTSSLASYTALFREPSSNHLLLLSRDGHRYWKFWESTDYGATWSGIQTLIDFGVGAQGYVYAGQNGSVLNCACFDHWSVGSGDHNAYFFQIHLDDGDITTIGGVSIGNLDGTSLPLAPADLDVAWSPEAGKNMRIVTAASGATNPEIILVDWDDATDDNARYHYVRWSGSEWVDNVICDAGETITGSIDAGFGGATFPEPTTGGVVYLCREAAGNWHVEKRTTADNGSSWDVEQIGMSRTVPLTKLSALVNHSSCEHELVWCRVVLFENYDDLHASLAGVRQRN